MSEDTQRVQFDISPLLKDKIEEMKYKCELATTKALFNEALSLLEWAIEEVSNGKEIVSIDKERKDYTLLRVPALQRAAHFAKLAKNS